MERTWSVMEVLQWTAKDLASRGIESARLDAEVLLAHVLGMDRVGLYVAFDRPLDSRERTSFRQAVERRRAGEPVAYIRGYKEFWGLELAVDPSVLIPRPETEILVEEALACLSHDTACRGLDVGTGSGAIPIALLKERPGMTFDAVDLSAEALAIAEKNAVRHGVRDRLRLHRGHLDEPVGGEPPYDLVTANLPYIPTGDIGTLPAGVREFEPMLALDGGVADGLGLVRALVDRAGSLLLPGGAMVLEVGVGQARAVAALGNAHPGLGQARVRKDYAGNERVVVLRRQ